MFGLRVKLHILLRIIDVFFLHNLENSKKNNRGVDCERESPRLFELIGLINCLVFVTFCSATPARSVPADKASASRCHGADTGGR